MACVSGKAFEAAVLSIAVSFVLFRFLSFSFVFLRGPPGFHILLFSFVFFRFLAPFGPMRILSVPSGFFGNEKGPGRLEASIVCLRALG